MKEFLPLGSVVLLKEGNKKLMICGRYQKAVATNIIYDYAGCYYPEGLISSKDLFLFNNEQIDRVYYVGMQDEEEFKFRNRLASAYVKEEGGTDHEA